MRRWLLTFYRSDLLVAADLSFRERYSLQFWLVLKQIGARNEGTRGCKFLDQLLDRVFSLKYGAPRYVVAETPLKVKTILLEVFALPFNLVVRTAQTALAD